MKTTRFATIICMLALCITTAGSIAQNKPDTTVLYRIETLNGNEYTGNILREDSARVYLREQKIGDISIIKTEIKHFDKIDISKIIEGEYWFENPQSSRYFWAPNGYGLKAGEGYYQNVWVLYNQASMGISDYFSLGAGMLPLFLFAGGSTPVWIVPKFSIPVVKEKFNLGAGAIAGTVLGEVESGFGILYGIATIGDRNNNLNLGLGYGYAGGNWAKRPLLNISAMIRTGSRGYLVTENYIISLEKTRVIIFSAGGRTIIKRVAAIDYGLIIPFSSEIDEFVLIPWLGITVPFGKKPNPNQILVR